MTMVKRRYEKKIYKLRAGMPTKRIYVCSPLRGNGEANRQRACLYCRFAYDKGFVPIAPHIYFQQFLDYTNGHERNAGRRYGMECMWMVIAVWVFGEVTEGMKDEIDLAEDLQIPVKYFTADMEELT